RTGAVICILAVGGIIWLYYPEIRRLRLRIVNDKTDIQSPSLELWLALVIAAVAVTAPASVYFYLTAPESHQPLPEIRHLRSDLKDRMRRELALNIDETYSFELNSMPSCDECEQFAEEIRTFVNTIPGWKVSGGPLIFAQPPRRGLWLIANESDQHLRPVDK